MNKKVLILLGLVALVVYYLNQEKSKKPSQGLLSNEPWVIPKTKKEVASEPKSETIPINSPKPKEELIPYITEPTINQDYSWLTDDNLEFILKNWKPIKEALTKANQKQKKFQLRTDLANIYNCFYKAKTSQEWDLPEFLERLEDNKHQYTLFPLRVNDNHWGLFILEESEETEPELQSNKSSFSNERQEPMEPGMVYFPSAPMVKLVTKVYYTSSGGGDLIQEKKQLQPFINQIIGENTPITIIQPKDRNSLGYECGVYLVFYIRELLETGKLELKRSYTSAECQEFRREWKERIGEKWGKWN